MKDLGQEPQQFSKAPSLVHAAVSARGLTPSPPRANCPLRETAPRLSGWATVSKSSPQGSHMAGKKRRLGPRGWVTCRTWLYRRHTCPSSSGPLTGHTPALGLGADRHSVSILFPLKCPVPEGVALGVSLGSECYVHSFPAVTLGGLWNLSEARCPHL